MTETQTTENVEQKIINPALKTSIDKMFDDIKPSTEDEQELDKQDFENARESWKNRFADWLKNGSGIESRYFDSDIENVQQKEILKNWADNPKGFLLILGGYGTGKTYTTCALLKYINRFQGINTRHTRALYCPMDILKAEYLDAQFGGMAVLERYAKQDFLVIDEVGRAFNQAFEQEKLGYIINRRYANNRPTVIVSNLDPKTLKDHLGDALIDRISEERTIVIYSGESLRKAKRGM